MHKCRIGYIFIFCGLFLGKAYRHAEHFHLPPAIMEAIKPIFKDLSKPELLEKCIHGKTQNYNESFNQVIWTRIPKGIFVGLETLKLGAFDAAACFNDGNIARCRVLEELNIEPGKNTVSRLKQEDLLRIKKADKDIFEASKSQRQKRSRARKSLEEVFTEAEKDNPSYAAGNY